jgi:hypothetical protein
MAVLTAFGAVLALAPSVPAANIVWVTDANDPAVGFFAPVSSHTDAGFVVLLQGAGHNVMLYNPPAAVGTLLTDAEITALNTNDLVIISRCVNSGIFQTGQGNQWNTRITKPLMDLSAFHARNSRLGWFAANEGPDNTPTLLSATLSGDAAHDAVVDYLFAGVPMNGTNTAFPFDELADRNSTPIPSAPVAGGVIYARGTYVQENSGATPTITTGNFITGYPAGTAVRGGVDVLGGYRMFFAAGSRESATVPNVIQFYTARENLSPTGENIFLRAVQVALNNGVAPASDPAAPVAVTSQPASVTVSQGHPAAFSVSVTGAAPRTVQWQRDIGDGMTFTNIPDASTAFSVSRLALPDVTPSDNGAHFRVVVSNLNNSVFSDVVTLAVTNDTVAPVLLSAASLDGATIHVCFDEVLGNDLGTVTDAANYEVDGGNSVVMTVNIQPDGRSLVLIPDIPVGATFTLKVANVTDRFGNPIHPDGITLNGTNLLLTSAVVGALNPAGTVFACSPDAIEISGGGLDLQSTSDQMQFAYKVVAGDFDARVRVGSLTGTADHLETTAKAILAARESADTNSAAVNVFVTPVAPGDNSISSSVRPSTGAATNVVSAAVPGGPPQWMRILREGNRFTTFRSTNGTDWVELGHVDAGLAPTLLVGLGVSSHRNARLATARFGSFEVTRLLRAPELTNATFDGMIFSASFPSQAGATYEVQFKNEIDAPMWQPLPAVPAIVGDGMIKTFTDPGPVVAKRYYRLRVQ